VNGMGRITFSPHAALTRWEDSPFALCVLVVLVGVAYWYLRADWQLAARGRRWPWSRTVAFLAGLAAIDVALQSPVATFTGSYFQAHVLQHLLLMVVAPPLLALGAPSTLLLQTASRRTKVAWLRVLRSRPFAVLTHPITVWILYFGVMFAFFLSSLINVAMQHMALMDGLNVLFLLGGCLYWWPMVGRDPIVHWRMGYGTRMVNILLGGPPEVILGLAILSSRTPIASMYSLASTHAGGALLWISTEVVVAIAFFPIFWQWSRSDERAGTRADTSSSRGVQPALAGGAVAAPRRPGFNRPLSNWELMWLARTGSVPETRDDGTTVTVERATRPARPAAEASLPLDEWGLSDPDMLGAPAEVDPGRTGRDKIAPDSGPRPSGRSRTRSRRRHSRRVKWALGGLVAAVVVVAAGPPLFFHLIDGNAPARLSLPPAVNVSNGPVIPGPVSGTWMVTAGSQAGYRVQEILLGQHHAAVGRTPKVSGGIVISGTTVTAADFTVDMASVRSDQPSRDSQFTGYIMKTYDYPHASFRLTQPVQLGHVPAPGRVVSATAAGQLNLRNVTRPITFRLQAERIGDRIDINAEIPITFSNWHIPNPSFAVTEVGGTGVIEVLLQLAPAHK
jgi:putative membrane protein